MPENYLHFLPESTRNKVLLETRSSWEQYAKGGSDTKPLAINVLDGWKEYVESLFKVIDRLVMQVLDAKGTNEEDIDNLATVSMWAYRAMDEFNDIRKLLDITLPHDPVVHQRVGGLRSAVTNTESPTNGQ